MSRDFLDKFLKKFRFQSAKWPTKINRGEFEATTKRVKVGGRTR
jgi:hypothetical protein